MIQGQQQSIRPGVLHIQSPRTDISPRYDKLTNGRTGCYI